MASPIEPTEKDLAITADCAKFFLESSERVNALANETQQDAGVLNKNREEINRICAEMESRYIECKSVIDRALPVFREGASQRGEPAVRIPSFPSQGFLCAADAAFAHGKKLIEISKRSAGGPPQDYHGLE